MENSNSSEDKIIDTNQKEEEEKQQVLIQFTDADEASYCEQFISTFEFIDIETKTPILQFGDRLYSGEYVNNIGTFLYFEKTTSTSDKESDHSEINHKYCGKGFKKLALTRLFVEERKEEEEGEQS
jgi:hypothetical protein